MVWIDFLAPATAIYLRWSHGSALSPPDYCHCWIGRCDLEIDSNEAHASRNSDCCSHYLAAHFTWFDNQLRLDHLNSQSCQVWKDHAIDYCWSESQFYWWFKSCPHLPAIGTSGCGVVQTRSQAITWGLLKHRPSIAWFQGAKCHQSCYCECIFITLHSYYLSWYFPWGSCKPCSC